MSFYFTAVGTRTEVIEQLAAVREGTNGTGELGPELAMLFAKHIVADGDSPGAGDYTTRYVITANGHSGGGSTTSLTASVQAHAIRTTAAG